MTCVLGVLPFLAYVSGVFLQVARHFGNGDVDIWIFYLAEF